MFTGGLGHDLAVLGNVPRFVVQPSSISVTQSSRAIFVASATGVPTPVYQWRKDGIDIPGATGSQLILADVQLASGGSYSAVASNAFGVLASSNALLTVLPLIHAPVARCTNVITIAGANCAAEASVDNGSFDPDGDPIRVIQIPPAPYPVGTNQVLLVVADNKGMSNSCSALVIVLDTTPAAIVCPPDMLVTNAHAAWASVVTFTPAVSDNCPGLSQVICNPASGSAFGLGTQSVLCSVIDASGNASHCNFQVTVLPGNVPPVPIIEVTPLARFAGETNLIVISPNNTNATVTFDGSKSYDLDDPNFLYFWLEGGNLFSTKSLATRVLALGTHQITLRLDDTFPLGTNSANVKVEVIASSEGVAIVINMLEGSNLSARTKRSLERLLTVAAAAFERGDRDAAVGMLLAFESRVKSLVEPFDSALAKELIAGAETVIQAANPSHGRPTLPGTELPKLPSTN